MSFLPEQPEPFGPMNYLLHFRRPTGRSTTAGSDVDPLVRQVFGPFQNLNLRILIEDLRAGRAARGDWASGLQLCPVAHGMPLGQAVADLCYLGQTAGLRRACAYASRYLGADPRTLARFIERWDDGHLARGRLLEQLDALWAERQADADAVQALLEPAGAAERQILALTETPS